MCIGSDKTNDLKVYCAANKQCATIQCNFFLAGIEIILIFFANSFAIMIEIYQIHKMHELDVIVYAVGKVLWTRLLLI